MVLSVDGTLMQTGNIYIYIADEAFPV